MIEATWPSLAITAAGADGRRTVAGQAVPWNVPGVVSSGDTVVFHPGSLDAAARPVLLRDHDRSRPIGTVTDATDTGAGLDVTARISATRDGDDALVLAADGALPMFSVGADPTDYRYDDRGVLHVLGAVWRELSLLSIGAYDTARVSTVTATMGGEMSDTLDAELLGPPDDDDTDDDDDGTEVPEVPEAVTVTAAAVPLTQPGRRGRRAGQHPYADVTMARLASYIAAAAGDPRYAAQVARIVTSPGARVSSLMVEAQLADVTLVGTDNIGALYRPAYQAELVDIVDHGAPLVNAFRQGDLQRGDYPNKTFNTWTKLPEVALQAAEKDPINSVPIAAGPASTPVQTWATGNDISQQTLDFGSPSFVEDYIRAAGADYSLTIETYAATAALAAAVPATTTTGASFLDVIGALLGALDPTKVPAGGLFLAMSWDGWVSMAQTTVNDGPAFWNGSVSFGSVLPSGDAGGLSIFYSPGITTPGTYLLGLRNAATWYDLPGTPFSLRAINVGQLGLDIAVYGYGALGVQYPGGLVKTTVPPAGP